LEKFKDIRPYQDSEIEEVIARLLSDQELHSSIANFLYPRLARTFSKIMDRVTRRKLKAQFSDVNNVRTMQDIIAKYMGKMIHDTTTHLTNSGLENLNVGRNYLFISNHRDITMDPAFVNYILYQAGYETLQIAIGDNLLKKPFLTDLMRLNKSFIVRRSLKGRELLQSLKLLSEYIHHSAASGDNVWIAQREGRSKDGIDKTDPALLKMLAMSRRDLPLGESLSMLNIIPVSISYEYDACDILKAEELYEVEKNGIFTKTDESDINSIVTGMIGFKGHVHVAFGKELEIETDDPEIIANLIDNQILENYRLTDMNYLATEQLAKKDLLTHELLNDALEKRELSHKNRDEFTKRLLKVESRLLRYFLFGYANPLYNKLISGYEV
jgi:1-acyl-sn-glycerol-3-phosphate acyltransferase